MKNFAIIGARKLPRTGCIAIICGALLAAIAGVAPAKSADFYPYEYTGYPAYNGHYRNCYPCGCNPCCRPCCYPCGCNPCVRRAPVVERHWDYWERRYPVASPYPYRYPNYPGGYAGGYPNYPYPDGYPGYGSGPRPRLGYGGIQYPPSPISYEYEAPPRPPYEYEASARPAYDYEVPPRPPVGMPGTYYNAGYLE